ncbi:MAG TPA: ribosome-associated translation inhibitor RaiA [Thermomicrobiales bacterium]|nr:ribosome-associated translation inhibitor RaiA [Thermomicrobiales bacterium]
MDVMIKAHNFKLSDGLREYVEKRVSKLDRVNERITEAKFEIREQPHHSPDERFKAQFTIATRKAILRAEDRSEDAHAAIDIVTDKMARQIRRFHDRKIKRTRRDAVNLGMLAADQSETSTALIEEAVLETGDVDGVVVRTKRFAVLPMDIAEALEQIELLGHDFFVFYNLDTSQLNVLYRRRGGQFGVLEPELA